ncbi:MAG: peptidoglycan DD-metalloendopeptidase family protein [OCS116 cluster bacterium]|nr:peptidoglycan DD-metalloendopeptidase family protein [OCS116 cluster bacterium]
MHLFIRFLAFFALFLMPFQAFSADNDGSVDLENLEIEIKSGQAKTQALQKNAAQIQAERDLLNKQIKVAAKQIQQSEAHLSSGEKNLETLAIDEDLLRTQYIKRKKILATLLSALLKLEKNPPPALLTKPEDASNALRSAIILGKIVPEVKNQTDIIAHDLANLSGIRNELTAQQNELLANTQELRKQRNYIAGLLEQKTALSSKTQAEIQAEQQKMAALGQKAKNIRDLFSRIEAQKKIEIELTAKKAAQREAKRQADLKTKQQQLAAAKQAANSQQITQIQNSITQLKKPPIRQARKLAAFNSFKNKLPYPAQGNLLHKFGEKDNQDRNTKGITISTRPFAQITSPASGTVLFADDFSNYGYLVIIDVGQDHRILLTGLGQIAVTTNQFIEMGDPIGIMPQNAINNPGNNAPILYVEFRKSENPINSSPWWQTKLAKN